MRQHNNASTDYIELSTTNYDEELALTGNTSNNDAKETGSKDNNRDSFDDHDISTRHSVSAPLLEPLVPREEKKDTPVKTLTLEVSMQIIH
ncbi:hypothetical protein DFQ30_004185 [Apophysomyces sp. BC1015]|nr:hypothetical protein DFQ30_004185 [Apophysomyces sp. BC1015]KAG0178534.1 hypothetical protein DFQ29_003317 [Apophysomyces sp. BC1021]